MRSRYTAFATGDVDHLWRTLDDAHVDRARPKDEVLRMLRDTCRRVRFMRLRVLDHAPAGADGFARVLFSVRAFDKARVVGAAAPSGRNSSFHELSRFRHDGVGWRYVDGASGDGEAPAGCTIAAFRSP